MRRYILKSSMLLLILLVGCKEYKLSKDDLKWQPYKVDDILVFESNVGEIDSIKITSIDSYLNPKDPLSVFADKHESLFVNGELLNPKKDSDHLGHVNFLNLFSDKDASVLFNLSKTSDSLKYETVDYSINQLNNLSNQKTITINCINDVIPLKPNPTGLEFEYEYDLETYWWSYQYGYVRYSFKNGYYRKLIKFLRNGKNILPHCGNGTD